MGGVAAPVLPVKRQLVQQLVRLKAGVSSAPHARSVPVVGFIITLHAFRAESDVQSIWPPEVAVKSGMLAAVTLHVRQHVDWSRVGG